MPDVTPGKQQQTLLDRLAADRKDEEERAKVIAELDRQVNLRREAAEKLAADTDRTNRNFTAQLSLAEQLREAQLAAQKPEKVIPDIVTLDPVFAEAVQVSQQQELSPAHPQPNLPYDTVIDLTPPLEASQTEQLAENLANNQIPADIQAYEISRDAQVKILEARRLADSELQRIRNLNTLTTTQRQEAEQEVTNELSKTVELALNADHPETRASTEAQQREEIKARAKKAERISTLEATKLHERDATRTQVDQMQREADRLQTAERQQSLPTNHAVRNGNKAAETLRLRHQNGHELVVGVNPNGPHFGDADPRSGKTFDVNVNGQRIEADPDTNKYATNWVGTFSQNPDGSINPNYSTSATVAESANSTAALLNLRQGALARPVSGIEVNGDLRLQGTPREIDPSIATPEEHKRTEDEHQRTKDAPTVRRGLEPEPMTLQIEHTIHTVNSETSTSE